MFYQHHAAHWQLLWSLDTLEQQTYWLWGYKTVSVLNSAEHEFILLINFKMPTSVGISKFINMINTRSERLKSRNFFICGYFSFYELLKYRTELSWAWKKFYNLGTWFR